MERERSPRINTEPLSKKLRRKSNVLLGGSALLIAAGTGTFMAGNARVEKNLGEALPLEGASLVVAGAAFPLVYRGRLLQLEAKQRETRENREKEEVKSKDKGKNRKPRFDKKVRAF